MKSRNIFLRYVSISFNIKRYRNPLPALQLPRIQSPFTQNTNIKIHRFSWKERGGIF